MLKFLAILQIKNHIKEITLKKLHYSKIAKNFTNKKSHKRNYIKEITL